MSGPYVERAAPAVTGNGSPETDRLGEAICSPLNQTWRLPQLRCEFCRKQFPKTAKRPARCCSRRCRDGLLRERARLGGGQVSRIGLRCCALKSSKHSKGYKATSRDPHPSQITTPIDILGRGHRWPNAARIDRKTWRKICWREIGGAHE